MKSKRRRIRQLGSLVRKAHLVGDAGDLDHFGDIVDTDDVRIAHGSYSGSRQGISTAWLALAAALVLLPLAPIAEGLHLLVEAGFFQQRVDLRA